MPPDADFQLRAVDRAMDQAQAALPLYRRELTRELVEEALGKAYGQCRWAADNGQTPYTMLAGFFIETSPQSGWLHALCRLSDLWLDELWPRLTAPKGGSSQGGPEAGPGEARRATKRAAPDLDCQGKAGSDAAFRDRDIGAPFGGE